MSRERYVLRWAEERDAVGIYKVFQEGAAGLGGPVPTSAIKSMLTPSRLFVILQGPLGQVNPPIVGASASRFPTQGVCYHMLFALSKSVRGKGLGGGMVTGILRFLAKSEVKAIAGAPGLVSNPYQAHKWFASYPSYNKDVDALYQAMGWALEGTLQQHTKNRTALIVRAFYVNEMKMPQFWHLMHPEAPVVDDGPLQTGLPPGVRASILGDIAVPDQGRDGQVW